MNWFCAAWHDCQQTGTQSRGSGGKRRMSWTGFGQGPLTALHWDPDAQQSHGCLLFRTLQKPQNFLLTATLSYFHSRSWEEQPYKLIKLSALMTSGHHRMEFGVLGLWFCRAWHRDGGRQQRWLQKVKVRMSQVIQEPGMWKEASTSFIQHGQDDCLPLLSLLLVFIWLRIHASSLVRFISPRDLEEWQPMGHVTGHNSFLGGGSFVKPVKVVDHSRQFSFTHCQVISFVKLVVTKTLSPFVIDYGNTPVLLQSS